MRIPAVMIPALVAAAKLISEGHAIDVIAADQKVSAQDAADVLGVSRPYLLNLVKKGILPCRMVGAHHRIPIAAVIAYKRDQAPRRRSLEALANDPEVAYISPDRPVHALLDTAAQQLGWTGKGIGIAIVDSGVSYHYDLSFTTSTPEAGRTSAESPRVMVIGHLAGSRASPPRPT